MLRFIFLVHSWCVGRFNIDIHASRHDVDNSDWKRTCMPALLYMHCQLTLSSGDDRLIVLPNQQ
jgi:hypothetical protein